jgi:post-segregation antitoxin (ccd killing protein)
MRAGRRYPDDVATTEKASVEIDSELLKRARRVARERGVEISQLVHDALRREIGAAAPRPGRDEDEQPPLTFIGAFRSGRGDLSKLASEDAFEPEPFR